MLGCPYFPSPAFPMRVLHNRLHSESTLCEGSGIGLKPEAMEHEGLFDHASASARTGKLGVPFGVGIKTEKIAVGLVF